MTPQLRLEAAERNSGEDKSYPSVPKKGSQEKKIRDQPTLHSGRGLLQIQGDLALFLDLD